MKPEITAMSSRRLAEGLYYGLLYMKLIVICIDISMFINLLVFGRIT